MKFYSARSLVLFAVLFGGFETWAAGAPISLTQLRAQRNDLAWKKRRVLVNNDGNEPYLADFVKRNPVPSREALLGERTAGLAGSQVDAIFYCTNAAVGHFSHGTKLGSLRLLDNDGGKTLVKEYIDHGLDPLRVMTDFAHANRMELFWSFRMNDTHDGDVASTYGPLMFDENEFKRTHPEYLMGPRPRRPGEGKMGKLWSALDFAVPAVRDYIVKVIEEGLQNYDLDGLELDFFRHFCFFKSTALGKPASESEVAQMTEFIGRIRELTEREGMRRGRPYLLAIKIPDSWPFCRAGGLDVELWLQRGWIDLLVCTGYYRLNPWEYSVALGRKYHVPVYASLDEPRIADGRQRTALEGYRGRALEAWNAGVDGIYLFNAFLYHRPDGPIWRELGDAAALAAADKDYFATDRGAPARYGIDPRPFLDSRNLPILTPKIPMKLSPGAPLEVPFQMADDFKANRQAGHAPQVILRLHVAGLDDPSDLEVRIGSQLLGLGERDGAWVKFAVEPAALKQGFNIARISTKGSAATGALLTDLQVRIRYTSALVRP